MTRHHATPPLAQGLLLLFVTLVPIQTTTAAPRHQEPDGIATQKDGRQKAARVELAVLSDREAYAALRKPDVAALARAAARKWKDRFRGLTPRGVARCTSGGQAHWIARFEHERTGLVFALVPGGTFLMGAAGTLREADRDETQHEVTLKPYLISTTECSQEAWVRGLAPKSDNQNSDDPPRQPSCHGEQDRLPVEQVSALQVDAWCRAVGLMLPTEAQWEYACRAGTTTSYSFGDNRKLARRFVNLADTSSDFDWKEPWDDGFATTAPVGSLAPNAFGLFDMHGNVWEWCRNDYVLPTEAAHASASTQRVARGGSYRGAITDVRSSYRFPVSPDYAYCYLGFRPSLDLPE